MSLLDEARKMSRVAVGEEHGGYLHAVSVVGASTSPRTPGKSIAPKQSVANTKTGPVATAPSKKVAASAADAAAQGKRRVLSRKPDAAAIAKKSPHLRALAKGASSAKRAEAAGLRAIQAGSAHKPGATKVQGACVLGALACGHDVYELVGDDWEIVNEDTDIRGEQVVGASPKSTASLATLTAKAKAKLTPKQRAAVSRHEAAIAKANTAAVKAVKAGNAAVKASKDLASHMKGVSPKIAKLFAWRGAGGLQTVLGYYDIIGADAQGRSPGDPGYDDTTDPDSWNYKGGAGGSDAQTTTDTTTDQTTDSTVPKVYTLETDPNVTPMPVRGKPLSKEDALAVWQKVPEDGIVFSEMPGEQEVGTWGIIYDQPWINERQGRGLIWHANPGQPLKWWRIGYAQEEVSPGIWRDVGPGHGVDAKVSSTEEAAQIANQYALGPLVGARRLVGLQYAVADGKWFWQGDVAPKWATAEADAVIATANKKIVEADNAAARAEAAAAAKDKADREAEAARQDAEMALAEKQAESERRVAESKAAAAATRQQSEDAATESALAAAQVKLDQQAAQIQLQAQQQQLAWLQQNGLPPMDLGTYDQDAASEEPGEGYVDQNGVPTPPTYRGDSDLATPVTTPEVPEMLNLTDVEPPSSSMDEGEAEVPAFDETEAQ